MEVRSGLVQGSLVHYLRTHTVMAVGDGTAPSLQGAQSGLTRTAYLRVDEISTWVFMGDDYSGQRGSILDTHFQITGVGATAFAAREARDEALSVVCGIQAGTETYLAAMPQVRPNETALTGYEVDPSPTQVITRRRQGGVLTVQHRTSEFFAPAYVIITVAVS